MSDPTSPLRRSPLHEVHIGRGAVMTDFAGWHMPLRYGSELAEHHAVRRQAGLFDLSHMGEFELSGANAAVVADQLFVSRVAHLDVGRARYTMLTNVEGGVLDDLIVYRRGDQHFLVVANAANASRVLTAISERVDGRCDVTDTSATIALIALQGPCALAVLEQLCRDDLASLRYYAAMDTIVAHHSVFVARTGYTGEDGFEVFCDAVDAAALWEKIEAAGAAMGVVGAGLACRDTLRLEAGMPLYGHELTEQLTPFDAGIGRIVEVDGRDFVGRDALSQRAQQPTATSLVGLAADGRRAVRQGDTIHRMNATQVGIVTSGALSPTLGHPIAMAYVDASVASGGEEALYADVRGRQVPVRLVELPFYRRPKH